MPYFFGFNLKNGLKCGSQERYAKGEITKEQFDNMKKDIS